MVDKKRKYGEVLENKDVVMKEADNRAIDREEESRDNRYSESVKRHFNAYPTASASTKFQDAENARKSARELSRQMRELEL